MPCAAHACGRIGCDRRLAAAATTAVVTHPFQLVVCASIIEAFAHTFAEKEDGACHDDETE